MDRKNNKPLNINGKELRLPLIPPHDDELFCLSDSEESSSSSNCRIFDNQPWVMELHGMQKDELPDNPLPEVKTRKLHKKKRPRPDQPADQDQSAGSLSSGSESSMVPPGPEKAEEFYDAHESYYDFPENQASAAMLTAPAVVASQQDSPEVKRAPESTALSADATTTAATQDTATGRTPITSAVTKPVHPSNPE